MATKRKKNSEIGSRVLKNTMPHHEFQQTVMGAGRRDDHYTDHEDGSYDLEKRDRRGDPAELRF